MDVFPTKSVNYIIGEVQVIWILMDISFYIFKKITVHFNKFSVNWPTTNSFEEKTQNRNIYIKIYQKMFKNINYIQNHIKYYWLSGKKNRHYHRVSIIYKCRHTLKKLCFRFFPSSDFLRYLYSPCL